MDFTSIHQLGRARQDIGRRDLLDLKHWATNLLAAEKMDSESTNFYVPRRSLEPCTNELSAIEC